MSYIYTKEPPTNGKVSMRTETAVPVALPFCKALNRAHVMVSLRIGSPQDDTGGPRRGAMEQRGASSLQELCATVPGRVLRWHNVS